MQVEGGSIIMKEDMSRMELLKQITIFHFMAEDLHLYLDTHPMDRDALVKHNAIIIQLHALKQNYEKAYGPLSEHGCCSQFPWQWINQPWPWEYEANFKLE